MRLVIGRIASALIVAGIWLLAGVRTVLDLIGYATVPEDSQVATGLLRDFLLWALSVPWWVPWGFALISTLTLIWVSWPRAGIQFSQTVVAGTKVVLPEPETVYQMHWTRHANATHRFDVEPVTAESAPPHSVATIRYSVGWSTAGEQVMDRPPVKIAIREVGSRDQPMLEGVGFVELKLNRHSRFEFEMDIPAPGDTEIRLWLVSWIAN